MPATPALIDRSTGACAAIIPSPAAGADAMGSTGEGAGDAGGGGGAAISPGPAAGGGAGGAAGAGGFFS